MPSWLFNPLYRLVSNAIKKTTGAAAKDLLTQTDALWSDIKNGVDDMLAESMREFIHDSALNGWASKDQWEDAQHHKRNGVSIPLEDLEQLVVFRAVQLGPKKLQEERDPWFTLSKFGMTPAVQAEVVSTIGKYRFANALERRVGSIVGEFGYTKFVLAGLRAEAYGSLPGTPKLVKLAEMHSDDKEDPSRTKRCFEKKLNYQRGKYEKVALLRSLPTGKFA